MGSSRLVTVVPQPLQVERLDSTRFVVGLSGTEPLRIERRVEERSWPRPRLAVLSPRRAPIASDF